MKKNKNRKFSLTELVVVIAMISVMVAIFAPTILSYVNRVRSENNELTYTVQEETDIYCDNCGTEVLEQYNYCFECGENLKRLK